MALSRRSRVPIGHGQSFRLNLGIVRNSPARARSQERVPSGPVHDVHESTQPRFPSWWLVSRAVPKILRLNLSHVISQCSNRIEGGAVGTRFRF